MAQTSTGLFRLPEKLRYRIYEEVLNGLVVCYPSRSFSRTCPVFDEEPQGPGILRASKMIFQETLSIYYATSYFIFNDICRLIDWSRIVSRTQPNKPSSICLVREVQLFEDDLVENDRSILRENSSAETSQKIGGKGVGRSSSETSRRLRSLLEELEEPAIGRGNEDKEEREHECNTGEEGEDLDTILEVARGALQDDINLAAEKCPRFRGVLIGRLYTLGKEGEVPQLQASVQPQSIFTKQPNRTADDAQYEQMLFRWGPFDDPFLDTRPGGGGLSARTKALAKLCNFVRVKKMSQDEEKTTKDVEARPPSRLASDDPFMDTPPRKSRTLGRTDSAINICGLGGRSARSRARCDPPRLRKVSPIKRVYPRSLVWKDAVVPKFEPHPSGRIWA